MAKALSKEIVSEAEDSQNEASGIDSSDSEEYSNNQINEEKDHTSQESNSESEVEESNSEEESSSEVEESLVSSASRDIPKSVQPNSIPVPTYKPPTGFRRNTDYNPPSSTITSTLSNLKGKYFFHIATPSSLPLSAIREIHFSKILNGEPIITHHGISYGVSQQDAAAQSRNAPQALFIYDKSTASYNDIHVRDIPTYHVQELINLPTKNDTLPPDISGSSTTAAEVERRGSRKQPKNLKMRFHPIGCGNRPPETFGSDSEDLDEGLATTTEFKVPPAYNKKEKRKSDSKDGKSTSLTPSEPPRKKSKKHSISSSQENKVASSSPSLKAVHEDVEKDRGRAKSEQRPKDKGSKRDIAETSQEPRRRKEEKKRRKVEKEQQA